MKDLQERASQAVERFLEDEALTQDLSDTQAKPFIQWLTQEANTIALDEKLSDEEVKERLRALKSSALKACKQATEESTAEDLIKAASPNLTPSPSPGFAGEGRTDEERGDDQ